MRVASSAPARFLGAIASVASALDPVATLSAQPVAARWQIPYIKARLENVGIVACRDGGWCGTRGEARRLEGFALNLAERTGDERVQYLCRSRESGPDVWVPEGEFCGTPGPSTPIEALAVRLVGRDADRFTISYQAYVLEGGESPVSSNGDLTRPGRPVTAVRDWLERR